MFDRKLLIPISLVFLFVLALLILPALDTSAKAQPEVQTSQNTSELTQQTDSETQVNYELLPNYEIPSSGESFTVSESYLNNLCALWPLSYVSADEFGQLSVEYIDADMIKNSSHLTFIFISELDETAAAKKYCEALFGESESPLFSGIVTADDESGIDAALDITNSEQGTLVSISFTIEDWLCITDALCEENPWLDGFVYPGLEDNMLVTEGITYTAPSGIVQYKVYMPTPEVKAQAFEWYSGFSDFPGFTAATLNEEQNFFFKQDGCKFNICEYMDSLIKITVNSTLQ